MAYVITSRGLGSDSPGEALAVGWPMSVRASVRATAANAQQNALQSLTSSAAKSAVRPSVSAGIRMQPSRPAPMVPARLGPLKQPIVAAKPNPRAMLAKLQQQPARAVDELENRNVDSAMNLAAARSIFQR